MKGINPTLLVQVIEFSKTGSLDGSIPAGLQGRRMVALIGEGYHGLWWEREDGDWERGAAVDLNRLIGATVEQKEF